MFIYEYIFVGIYGTRLIANDSTWIQNYKHSAIVLLGGIHLYLIWYLGHRYLHILYKPIQIVTSNMPIQIIECHWILMNNPTRVQQPILFNCLCVPNKKIPHVTTQLNHGTRQLQQYPQDFNTESSAHETVHYTVTNSTTYEMHEFGSDFFVIRCRAIYPLASQLINWLLGIMVLSFQVQIRV